MGGKVCPITRHENDSKWNAEHCGERRKNGQSKGSDNGTGSLLNNPQQRTLSGDPDVGRSNEGALSLRSYPSRLKLSDIYFVR